MALTTSNVKPIAVNAHFIGIGEAAPLNSWQKVFDQHTDDVASLRIASMTGAGNASTWDGTADFSYGSIDRPGHDGLTLAYQGYELAVAIGKYTNKDVQGLVEKTARKMAWSAVSTFANVAWTEAATFDSATVADGKNLCANDHTTTSTTRDNLITSALDRAAFMSAIQMFREWVNYEDQVFDIIGMGWALALLVPPELEEVACQIVKSVATDADLQVNVAGMYNVEVIVVPHFTDANDWCLVAKKDNSPFKFWTRSPLDFMARVDQDNKRILLASDFAIVADSGPEPDGIVGASVT